jgi:hypothetical protein
MINIKCYNEWKEYKTKEEAQVFFLDCMANSEGAESERYKRIYLKLKQGRKIITDEVE